MEERRKSGGVLEVRRRSAKEQEEVIQLERTQRKFQRVRRRSGGNRQSHFTSTDFGRNASISTPPFNAEDAEEDEEEEGDEELGAALGRLYM